MNSLDISSIRDEARFDALLDEHLAGRDFQRPRSRRTYRHYIANFRLWWLAHGEPDLIREILLSWMLDRVQRIKVRSLENEIIGLNQFMSFLAGKGIFPSNPLIELRKGYRSLGYRGILEILQRTGSATAALASADYPFSGPLGPACLSYLELLEALGKNTHNQRHCLTPFEDFLRRRDVVSWRQVDRVLIEEWLGEHQPITASHLRWKVSVLRDLFQFLIDRGEVTASPVPPPGPVRQRPRPPRIFTIDEVRAILNEAANLPDHPLMRFRGPTYRMFFLTLYTLGLRGGEAAKLKLGDLDFVQSCLTIVHTKFYKGRVLPFGPCYASVLRTYIDSHPLLRKGDRNTYLFPPASHNTSHLEVTRGFRALQQITTKLGIAAPPEIQPPCLHSFRHGFAVYWMERWLREGADIEVKLPLLSAFLGHWDIAATQVYLTMTPERLRLLSERFENAVGKGVIR